MKIKSTFFSYLVQPNKRQKEPIGAIGSDISFSEQICGILTQLSKEAKRECDINIIFSIGEDGVRTNQMHDLLVNFCKEPSLETGLLIANRLGDCTSNTSGQCLLFLVHTLHDDGNVDLLISRFPAEFGILAENEGKTLTLEFVDQVFMKSHNRYKAAIYTGKPVEESFWLGRATDKQVKFSENELANYWIYDFLDSIYKDTSALGTMRVANAIREAIKISETLDTKMELTRLAVILPNLDQ